MKSLVIFQLRLISVRSMTMATLPRQINDSFLCFGWLFNASCFCALFRNNYFRFWIIQITQLHVFNFRCVFQHVSFELTLSFEYLITCRTWVFLFIVHNDLFRQNLSLISLPLPSFNWLLFIKKFLQIGFMFASSIVFLQFISAIKNRSLDVCTQVTC